MTEQDLLQLRDLAEAGQVQFKERIVNKEDKYEIGCEMVAFSNSRGGRLIILPYTGAGSGVRRALEYDPNVIFSNGVNQREITHSANEYVITIPRKSDQVTNQANLVTDPASPKSEQPIDQNSQNTTKLAHNTDPASPKSEQPIVQNSQNTTKLAHNTDPASPKSEQPIDQNSQNTTKLAHTTDPASSKSEQPHIKLSQKQKDIRNFCSIPRTAKDIMNRLGLSDFYNNRKRYIYDLVEAGVLERTIPNKPNDPNQKYRRKQ